MKLKVFLFRFAVAVAALAFGISFTGIGQYLKSASQTRAQEPAGVQSLKNAETVAVQPAAQTSPLFVLPAVEQNFPLPDPEQNPPWEFDPEGDYYIIGDLPKGFKDFDLISINTRDYETESEDYPNGIPIPPKGFLRTTRNYNFTRISISKKEMSFETETKKGISYKFTGKFPGEEKYHEVTQETIGLEGRLIKIQNGKKVAESRVSLAMYFGC